MGVLQDSDKAKLSKVFEKIEYPISIMMFTQEMECQFCHTTRELLEELASLSDKISLSVHDFVKDKELSDTYSIDKIPATVLIGEKDYGIRFFGVPAGYELNTLIEMVLLAGRHNHQLPGDVVSELSKLNDQVHMQVLVSPT